MSKLHDLSLWSSAITHLDSGRHGNALSDLRDITEQSSRIRWNIAAVTQRMGQTDEAIQEYTNTIQSDKHNALSYYQRACLHYRKHSYRASLQDFTEAHSLLRGGKSIDYTQLGLRYMLHECDILHNQGLCELSQGDFTRGMELLLRSRDATVETRRQHIDNTLSQLNNTPGNAVALSLILLPEDAIFKPPKQKVNHLKEIDFLGKPKLVASRADDFTGFSGKQLLDVASKHPRSRSAPVSPGASPGSTPGSTPSPGPPLPSSTSPRPARALGPGAAEKLVSQLHTALSPERDRRFLRSGPDKANTTPAQWSPGQSARGSQGRIPPPPSRPMPRPPQNPPAPAAPAITVSSHDKRGQTQVKGHGATVNGSRDHSPVVPPPPPLPGRAPLTAPPSVTEEVTVTMICASECEVTVPQRAALATVMDRAAKSFLLSAREFDVWSKDAEGEYFVVKDNRKMQRIWDQHNNRDMMTLWIFAKQ